jgi:cytochrome c peroxidase
VAVAIPCARTTLGRVASTCLLSAALAVTSGAQAPSPFAPLPLHVESPADNPTTPEKVALGKLLFWDPILSGAQDVACATCHHPDHGYADGRELPIGAGGTGLGPKRTAGSNSQLVKRNSPTILNVAFNGLVDASSPYDPTQAPMFWDSRVRGLEAQALAPIESFEEMRGGQIATGGGVAGAVARVAAVAEYQDLFRRVFGEADAVNAVNLSRAIAAFERSLVSTDSRFDRYLRGDKTALNAVEQFGMEAFDTQGCTLCHRGPMLSDYQVHVLGVPDNRALGAPDTGADGRGAFRTPSLRNLAVTAPYMHGGTIPFVDTVVADFYRRPGNPRVDPLLSQVAVESNGSFITAFLATLNGTFDRSIPERVPSGLTPGGR